MLADIGADKIDIIVAYKVDRLTPSRLDFPRLIEAFDKAGTSSVSITQPFNTTTSMGHKPFDFCCNQSKRVST